MPFFPLMMVMEYKAQFHRRISNTSDMSVINSYNISIRLTMDLCVTTYECYHLFHV